MDSVPPPGHVSRDRLLTPGAANFRTLTPALGQDLAAPFQAVLSYDELLDAR